MVNSTLATIIIHEPSNLRSVLTFFSFVLIVVSILRDWTKGNLKKKKVAHVMIFIFLLNIDHRIQVTR